MTAAHEPDPRDSLSDPGCAGAEEFEWVAGEPGRCGYLVHHGGPSAATLAIGVVGPTGLPAGGGDLLWTARAGDLP